MLKGDKLLCNLYMALYPASKGRPVDLDALLPLIDQLRDATNKFPSYMRPVPDFDALVFEGDWLDNPSSFRMIRFNGAEPVEVVARSGKRARGRAGDFEWSIANTPADIVRYRFLDRTKKQPKIVEEDGDDGWIERLKTNTQCRFEPAARIEAELANGLVRVAHVSDFVWHKPRHFPGLRVVRYRRTTKAITPYPPEPKGTDK